MAKSGISLADNQTLRMPTDERPSDAANDFGDMFGEDGFGGDFGGGLMDLPPVPDLTIDGSKAKGWWIGISRYTGSLVLGCSR